MANPRPTPKPENLHPPWPRRWVVERTFAWLGRFRRMSKDYEFNTSTSKAMIHLAMINIMTRRLAVA